MGAAAALGGAGLVAGYLQNQSQQSQANKARKAAMNAQQMALMQSQPLIDRQVKFFDQFMEMVMSADKSGQFDPAGQMRRLNTDNAELADERLKQVTGAAKRLGYAPGDTRVFDMVTATNAKSQTDRDRLASQLRRDLFFDKINAYSGAPVQGLSSAANAIRGLASDQTNLQLGMMQNAQSQMSNPSAFFNSIMPFFNQPSSNVSNQNQWNIDWLRQNHGGWLPNGWSAPSFNFGAPSRYGAPIDEVIN